MDTGLAIAGLCRRMLRIKNVGKPLCDISFNISSNALPVVPTCRDLGVNVTSDLAPSVHIDHIIVKAHQRAYMHTSLFCVT